MIAPWIFIVGGLVWLATLIIAVALCRAAALGDQQAEIIHLRPLHAVEGEDEHDGVVIPFDGGSAA